MSVVRIRGDARFVWAVTLIGTVLYMRRPDPLWQLVAMVGGVMLIMLIVVSIASIALRWRERGWRALVVPSVSLAIIPVGLWTGAELRAWELERNMDRYRAAARWAESQPLDDDDSSQLTLPEKYADLAYTVHVSNVTHCGLIMEFFWAGAFPVRHIARMYMQAASIEDGACRGQWAHGRQIADHWYEVRD